MSPQEGGNKPASPKEGEKSVTPGERGWKTEIDLEVAQATHLRHPERVEKVRVVYYCWYEKSCRMLVFQKREVFLQKPAVPLRVHRQCGLRVVLCRHELKL